MMLKTQMHSRLFIEIPGITGNSNIAVHQNTVHAPQTIFKALYTAVYQQVPPEEWMLNSINPCGANFAIAAFPHQPQQACEGQVISDLTRVQDSTIATAIETTIAGLTPGGSTPLLAGIETASGLFGNADRKALVLLSDGFQNCPSIAGAEASQIARRIQDLNANAIHVHAIGFGQPAEVPHDLLNEMGTATEGGFYDVTANPNFNPDAWDPGNALQETYKAVLLDTLQLESAAGNLWALRSG